MEQSLNFGTPDISEENENMGEIQRKNVCKFFLQKNCHHVRDRTNCNFLHPKLYHSWTKKGFCKDTSICGQFYHPKLCNSSKNTETCSRSKCNYFHLPNTTRSSNEFNPTQPAQPATYNTVISQSAVSNTSHQTSNNGNNQNNYGNTFSNQGFQNNKKQKGPNISQMYQLIQNLSTKVDSLVTENASMKNWVQNWQNQNSW